MYSGLKEFYSEHFNQNNKLDSPALVSKGTKPESKVSLITCITENQCIFQESHYFEPVHITAALHAQIWKYKGLSAYQLF